MHDLAEKVTKDWIELVTEVPEDVGTMIVALRFRNTLFHTVQFYDIVLKGQGVEAVDWIGAKTSSPIYLTRLYNWYQKYFGLHVELWNGRVFQEKVFIDDTGPIAWRQVAFELRVPRGQTARLRFSFLPDNVMLDWIGISFDSSPKFAVREVECSEIIDVNGKRDDLLPSLIEQSDDRYLITYPAESYLLKFDVGDEPESMKRTYFLGSRGFYIEWIRQDWLESLSTTKEELGFQLNEASIIKAARCWITKKADFERQFFNSRISAGGKRP